MKAAVISYSLTGNNDALAKRVAEAFGADHIKITEQKRRTNGTIIFDMMLSRTPKVQPAADISDPYDLLVLVGPVWLGRAASPLRSYLKYIREQNKSFAFLSISGGALNTNPKLRDDLKNRAGRDPELFIDQHIADLLQTGPKPAMKDTSAYTITGGDLSRLMDNILKTAGEKLGNAGESM